MLSLILTVLAVLAIGLLLLLVLGMCRSASIADAGSEAMFREYQKKLTLKYAEKMK